MFRPFRLLRLALEAEGLRWRRTGRGLAIRAGLGVAALLFALLLLIMLHAAAWAYLAQNRGNGMAVSALLVAAVDLLLLAILGFLVSRSQVDPIAIEAERVRNDALRQVGETTARAAVLAPIMRSRNMKKGLVGAALTAAVVGLIARR